MIQRLAARFQRLQCGLSVGQEGVGVRSRLQPPGGAMKQPPIEIPLQARQPSARGGERTAQLFGDRSEAVFRHQSCEQQELG